MRRSLPWRVRMDSGWNWTPWTDFVVADAHDFALGGLGGDGEVGGHGGRVDDEGVVAGGVEGVGESGEDAVAVVEDGRGFAVHEAPARTTVPP